MVVSESSVDDGFQSSKVVFKSGSGLWYTEHTRNMMHVLAYVASMVYCYSSDMYQAPTPLHVKVLCRGFKSSVLKGPPITSREQHYETHARGTWEQGQFKS